MAFNLPALIRTASKLTFDFAAIACIFIMVLASSCSSAGVDDKENTMHHLFTKLPSSQTGVEFSNNVKDGPEYNILSYRNFYNGGGVALGDINNDGLTDIFLTANLNESVLYLNKGNFQFENITVKSGIKLKKGWRTGVAMADVNGDGWLDIYVCNSGDIKGDDRENELYINNHDNTFEERAKELGLNDRGFSTHVSFFDFDLDGDLDCYMLNNSFVDVRKFDLEQVRKIRDTLGGHKLLRNDNGKFVDISEKAGISGTKIAYGLGVSVGDINGDMYPDIYVSNDFYEKDYLYINQKNGTYLDELPQRMAHISSSSMGADLADINNDGAMDIITTDMLPESESRVKTMTRFEQYHVENMKYRYSFHYQYPQNCLQLNNGNGTFSELAFLADIAATDWSWGALTFDFNNDGRKDVFISNGVYKDISDMDFSEFVADKQNVEKIVQKKGKFDFRDFLDFVPSVKLPNYAFLNIDTLHFSNMSDELGFGEPTFSNGVAYGDLDNDGDMDLVINNINAPCLIYRNETNKQTNHHYLKISFQGKGKNTFGTGAWLNLYAGGQLQVLQNMPVRSFQSCVDNKLVFGLGNTEIIDSLEIIWPDLTVEKLFHVKTDTTISLQQSNARGKFIPKTDAAPFFGDKSNLWMNHVRKHMENNFNAFDIERLLPYMLSTQGPRIAIGDANGDGLPDIFVGSSAGDTAGFYIQTKAGFINIHQQAFAEDSEFEDADACMMDIDKDGDEDLMVVSGGYQYDQGSSLLNARLYKNDGKGHFKKEKMPAFSTNASCIIAADFNHDGYTDVFIGGRAVSGQYGLPGRSFLLVNRNGVFRDETTTAIQNVGMVTDAVWTDLNKDGYQDLVIVGEWMEITYFINEKGELKEKKTIPGTAGLWNCIAVADMDNDGDDDYLLGNWGLNSRFRATVSKPMEMYVSDFDANGISESIISYYWPDNKKHLYPSKEDITSQIPSLKKKFLRYKDYADKSPEEVLGKSSLEKSLNLKVQTLASSILYQDEFEKFRLEPLPIQIQSAPVMAMTAGDLNNDNYMDIVAGGNFFDIKPDIGRMDAQSSALLLGKGNGKFKYVSTVQSGLGFQGQVRDIVPLRLGAKKGMIFTRNNDSLKLFEINKYD
jgi:hypothetical protein